MIISDKHRYLFVELPRTGSSAISRELLLNYDGREFLKKHATYRDFLAEASAEQRRYFVFSCIRNPLDKVVSLFYKYKTRHSDLYTNQERLKKQNLLVRTLMKRQFRFVSDERRGFQDFFLKFYRLPYNDWASLDHARFDQVLRFERLEQDFAAALRNIGIEPVRSLPVVNATDKDASSFWEHYSRPDVRRRAVWVFGPYLREWGYEFPADWQVSKPSLASILAFRFANFFRNGYWRYLR